MKKYALTSDKGDSDFWGFAHAAEGLFTPLPGEEGARRVHLAGCLPQGALQRCVDHVGSRRAVAGNAWFELLDGDGATMGSYFVNEVTVIDVKPSAGGAGLVDLTVTRWCENPLPGAERPWELIRTGHLNHTGMWHELAPKDRLTWLSVALWSREYQRQGKPDAPAGQVFTAAGARPLRLPCAGTPQPRLGRGWQSACPSAIASSCCSTSYWRSSRNEV
ncbi:hypothetical protein [Streptomyces sp. NRRL B-1140]|uniref:hypothetical protein n=1 Tax=Streptomyces sp. NRRL B-1140 TaxID=1415549 RepID=UPI000A6B0ECC|nr:hypothetical protein [Streptomyces sp. NRRL B-1140]